MRLLGSDKTPSIPIIKKEVCDHLGLEGVDLCGKDRHLSVAYARRIAMYLSRSMTSKGLVEIGKAFDRDHTTVLSACRKVEEELLVVVRVQRDVSAIKKKIEAKLAYDVKPCSKIYTRACSVGESGGSCLESSLSP